MTSLGLKMLPRFMRKSPTLTFTFLAVICIFIVVFVVSSAIPEVSNISFQGDDPVLEQERHALDDSLVHLQKDFAKLEAELKYEKLKSEMLTKDLEEAKKHHHALGSGLKKETIDEQEVHFFEEQERRRAHIKEVCAQPDRPPGILTLLVPTKDGLTYCVTRRASNTFWLQVFRYWAQDYEGKNVQSPLDITKSEVHDKAFSKLKKVSFYQLSAAEKTQILQSTTFISVQDPFKRLWETYVDILMLPKKWSSLGIRIEGRRKKAIGVMRKSLRPCGSDIQFEEFVQFVIGSFEPDFDSYYRQCDPCQLDPTYIIKGETADMDNRYVLKHMNMAWVVTADNFTEDTVSRYITDTVNESLLKLQEAVREKCSTPMEMGKRLYQVFEFMGIVPSGMSVKPIDAFSKKDEVITNVKNLYKINKQRGLDRDALKRKYLIQAVKTLSTSSVEGIRKKFKMDFDLFEYNDTPADMFS